MTTLSAPTPLPPIATVLVHCGALSGPRLERRVRSVVSTVPDDVAVVATVTGDARLRPRLAGRVQVLRLGPDDGLGAVETLVAGGRGLVVLPYAAEVASGWYQESTTRCRRVPFSVSVGRVGDEHVFVYPSGLTDPDLPRQLWPETPHIGTRAPRTPAATVTTAPPAHRTLGAVLIVKDEERNLAACLAAVTPLVDEVVVYDTGSTDGTCELARQAGALVVEGYWDNDFAAARNRALAHCTSDWFLSVDADEVAVADRAELRAWLDGADGTQAVVRVISTTWEGDTDGFESRANRLSAREGARWEGALHEQVICERPDARAVSTLAPVVLRHSGYSAVALKEKRGRNAGIVREALERAEPGTAQERELVAHLVRSLLSTHLEADTEEAAALAETLLEHPASDGNMAQVARVMSPVSIMRGDVAAARRWIAAARRFGESPGQCDIWTAAVMSGEGDNDGARTLLEALLAAGPDAGGQDRWGALFDPRAAETALAEVEFRIGDVTSAARRVVEQLHSRPETVEWKVLTDTLGGIGWTLGDLAEKAPEAFITRSLRDASTQPPRVSLLWFAALVELRPDDPRPVVAGCVAAARSSWADAAEWEMLARSRGLDGISPLSDLADDPSRELADRAAALALLGAGFQEVSALRRLEHLVEACDPSQVGAVREALLAAAPELLGASA